MANETLNFSFEEILEFFFQNREAGYYATKSQCGFFRDDQSFVKTELAGKIVYAKYANIDQDGKTDVYYLTEEELEEHDKKIKTPNEKLRHANLMEFSQWEAVRIIGGAYGNIGHFEYNFLRGIKKKRGICHLDKSPSWDKCCHVRNEMDTHFLKGGKTAYCIEGWPPYYKRRTYEIITVSGERLKATVDDSREFFSEGREWTSLTNGRNIEKDAVIAWKEIG